MSHTKFNLQRFLDAQEGVYPVALKEIRNGGKRSHWIWYLYWVLACGKSPMPC